jgi:hypothetical protein
VVSWEGMEEECAEGREVCWRGIGMNLESIGEMYWGEEQEEVWEGRKRDKEAREEDLKRDVDEKEEVEEEKGVAEEEAEEEYWRVDLDGPLRDLEKEEPKGDEDERR